MRTIGITGPTGAGKSTALQALAELGAETLDADRVYHELLSESAPLRETLKAAFGPDILDEAGQVDRRRLAGAVYPDKLDKLSALTHPFVAEEIGRRLAAARAAGRRAAAIDAIGLIESGLAAECDAVVAVLAPLETRLARIMERDGISRDYALRRALAQKDDAFFRTHADYVLENPAEDGEEGFARRARTLFETLLA